MNNGNGVHSIPSAPIERQRQLRGKEGAPEMVEPVRVTTMAMLNQCWPYVCPRLEWIKRKDKSAGHWSPEHIRFYIQEGLLNPAIRYPVELYVALDKEGVIYGFLAGAVKIDPYIQIPLTYHIWALWLNRAMIERMMPWFDGMVRERGLTGATFESGRIGWMGAIRKLMESGFYCHQYVYRKEIRP